MLTLEQERLMWVTVIEQSLRQAGGAGFTLRSSLNRPPLPRKNSQPQEATTIEEEEEDATEMKSERGNVEPQTGLQSAPTPLGQLKRRFSFSKQRASDEERQSFDSHNSGQRQSQSKGWKAALANFRGLSPDRESY